MRCHQSVCVSFVMGAVTFAYFVFSLVNCSPGAGRLPKAHRAAASRTADIASSATPKLTPEVPGSTVVESVTFTHPETNEAIGFVGFRMSKGEQGPQPRRSDRIG